MPESITCFEHQSFSWHRHIQNWNYEEDHCEPDEDIERFMSSRVDHAYALR